MAFQRNQLRCNTTTSGLWDHVGKLHIVSSCQMTGNVFFFSSSFSGFVQGALIAVSLFLFLHGASFPTYCGGRRCGRPVLGKPTLYSTSSAVHWRTAPNPVNRSPADCLNTACHWGAVGRRLAKSSLLWGFLFYTQDKTLLDRQKTLLAAIKQPRIKQHPCFLQWVIVMFGYLMWVSKHLPTRGDGWLSTKGTLKSTVQ